MPVLYSTNIWVGNKPKYVKIWYEHGAKIISDFFDKDGNVLITCIYMFWEKKNTCIKLDRWLYNARKKSYM